ncbi:MAG: hypothetical protein LBF16_00560 [Pseudomonadales bacterium]|jgi:pyruvate,water dikinase|nr:hypothetical protein [Pseudomonadales bacterium]
MDYALPFSRISSADHDKVGGKNATLGELAHALAATGIRIPDGFALTVAAYHDFLTHNQLAAPLQAALASLDRTTLSNLAEVGAACRALVLRGTLPEALQHAIGDAYEALFPGAAVAVAVRSSASITNLASANIDDAQHDSFLNDNFLNDGFLNDNFLNDSFLNNSFLNIQGTPALLTAVLHCYASLFNDHAIHYRVEHRIPHEQVALSIGVQRMVRADLGSAGLAFTWDPESRNRNVIYLSSSWGLGENVTRGTVTPDVFYLFKAGLGKVARPIVRRRLGAKEQRLVYNPQGPQPTLNAPTKATERRAWSLADDDITTLGLWCLAIEQHYGCPMAIEWARDGESGELFIVQARPEIPPRLDTTPAAELATKYSTCTRPLLILSDPDQALHLAHAPSQGVGLLRTEFIITQHLRVHPMALVHFDLLSDARARLAILELTRGFADKRRYFSQTLAEAVGLVAAAFHPRDVLVRMSDFKTNEYAQLLGGAQFEPEEKNPMLGFRGASRYYHPRYRAGFGLECEAMRMVRDDMGLTNVKLMIPFCRTVEEGRQVLSTMAAHGLQRGENGLEVYMMAELPSNVILATAFAELFDGFSLGSNDLTQLILGIDRDSVLIKDLCDVNNPAVKQALTTMITQAKTAGIPIGLCGQAPSDHPDFARFLVEQGIDSISFTADALFKGIENIQAAEGNVTPCCRKAPPSLST